jgi:hypothetical protein
MDVDNEAGVRVYECSGLRIASAIPLPARCVEDADPLGVDLTIERGAARNPPFERPSADVVAELLEDGYPRYTICRVDGGYVCRVVNVADFVIDEELRKVTCHPVSEGRDDVIPIIIAGTVSAFVLAMGGRCVLHGSAVEVDGRVIAFVGISGQGKSTMAAMFCARGASLVTDDVLPLEFESEAGRLDSVHCLRSSEEIRLRPNASSLADRFDDPAAVRVTPDERHAVKPLATALQRIPLSAVVLPRPDREISRVSVRTLPDGEASFWLNRCQRIEGWRDRDLLRRQFADAGRVAASVPVFEVMVPWGPPFAQDLPAQVLKGCGLDQPVADLRSAPGSGRA